MTITSYLSRCECPRCLDPSECGTLASALRCPVSGCPAPVLPRLSLATPPTLATLQVQYSTVLYSIVQYSTV